MTRDNCCSPAGIIILIVMIKINYSTRVFLYPKYGSVCVRVRWNKKRNSVDFTTGDYADISKWDSSAQRAAINTKHVVRDHEAYAWEINKRIAVVLGYVEKVFRDFEEAGEIPDSGSFRAAMGVEFDKETQPQPGHIPTKSLTLETMDTIVNKYIADKGREESWKNHSKYKYTQIVGHLLKYKPGIRIDQIDKDVLLGLRTWLYEQKRHNSSIRRWFDALKAILYWCKENGYSVKEEALAFRHHIIVPEKQIIYLKYDELLAFHRFEFPSGTPPHIIRARDLFCFMAFTSLRYSDMSTLKKSDISNDFIVIYTVKTHDKLNIPVLSYAQEILDRYADLPGDLALPAPSNQKLNKSIKEAAKIAGLSRTVVETYYIDKDQYQNVSQLWETLSCHDGRRTFVCCSLRLGMAPTMVMKCTGHSCYEHMKPYIDIADDAVAKEMSLWETTELKREIMNLLDKASDSALKKALKILKK